MYKIDKTSYGFKLTFGGQIEADEMLKWVVDARQKLNGVSGKFGVLVDMRELKPLPLAAQAPMKEGQQAFKTKGMERSVVILKDPTTTLQFKRLAKETGIYAWERYINAGEHLDWEKIAISWITAGTDPDKR
ncbi:MAG: hypothetical protein WCS77_03900 [Elusimicrobiaceae bacterium]